MEKIIIAAVADNLAIGKDNALLWHISADLKHFKEVTSGYPVIMGRKTFESIGRPLPGRANIIVSASMVKDGVAPVPGTFVARSLDEAVMLAETMAQDRNADGQEKPCKCFFIGGGEIYRQSMEIADTLHLTHIHTRIEVADTFFPEIDPLTWKITEKTEMMTDARTGYEFEFVTYRRI